MDTPQNSVPGKSTPVICLLAGATVWGLIWYPYRVLAAQGMSGIEATILTYLAAFLIACAMWHKRLRGLPLSPMLCAVALAAGGCNLGFVMGTLTGEVTRVLLLFYLSPLWTVIFARLILGERLSPTGALIIAISLTGACIMLWNAEAGLPWPHSTAEWLGLGAGICFALSNVLIKKTSDIPMEQKVLAVFVGVMAWGCAVWPFVPRTPWQLETASWLMLVIVGLTLVFTNAIVQYAIVRTRASQAIVVMLFELVVAAIASWFLAGESLGLREWAGGTLIVGASLLATRMAND